MTILLITIHTMINSQNLDVSLRIGKNGLNESVIDEIKLQLKKKKIIKIKMLKSAMEEKSKAELIKEIVERSNGELLKKVGNVIVLGKKHNIFIPKS